jgi:hypothetical protein
MDRGVSDGTFKTMLFSPHVECLLPCLFKIMETGIDDFFGGRWEDGMKRGV